MSMQNNLTKTQTATRKVLLIDDDEGIRRMLRFALRSAGFDVSMATTGGEALAYLDRNAVDAVVLDLGLPDGLGGSVLSWLHKQPEGRVAPAWVVISAQDQQDARVKYGPLGKHFLSKPFDPWDLVDLLDTLVAKKDN